MPEPILNVPLLRKVMEHVEDTPTLDELSPEHFAEWNRTGCIDGRKMALWDQGVWRSRDGDDQTVVEYDRCGTAMCFAGWAAQIAGGRWADTAVKGSKSWVDADVLLAEPGDDPLLVTTIDVTGPRGGKHRLRVVEADERATRLLGLTEEQSNRLFNGANTRHDLRSIVADLIKEHDAALLKEADSA